MRSLVIGAGAGVFVMQHALRHYVWPRVPKTPVPVLDQEALNSHRARADAKLRYAEVHVKELEELEAKALLGGSDLDRAHQESFLFHLFGAKDAFLIELNVYYEGGLRNTNLSMGKLRKALRKQGRGSPELAELYKLERNKTSWLSHAKGMRDHSTHVLGVPRTFHHGGEHHQKVFLRNPDTGRQNQQHFVEEFVEWVANMRTLLERLRESSIASMRAQNALDATQNPEAHLAG
jgi:hypothetical protein